MSSEALAWAFKQDCKSSSVKFTLVALCECANYKTGRITPSIAHIAEITGQNRKTIIANIAALEAQGLIADTGERVGRTGQIKVYEAAPQTVPKAEQSQKRNSSVSGRKESQKRDTEPSLEPSSSVSKKPKITRIAPVARPDEVDEAVWRDFNNQRKKRLTDTALEGIKREAAKAGWLLNDALAYATLRGWEGFFAKWVKDKDDGGSIRQGGSSGADRRSGLARAIDGELRLVSAFP